MNLKALLRSALYHGARFVAARTIFSRNRRIRSVGFEVISDHQELIACTSEQREAFVVRARDEWIGRGLFVAGEFDFDKFVCALDVLAQHRAGAFPKVLIDVGANIGSICIPAVFRGYFERAVAIEPDPKNSRLLRANVALNGLDAQIRVVEAAAGSSEGELLELELSESNFGDHRIRVSNANGSVNEASREVIKVPSSTLDSICREEQSSDVLIWMDVQGFEGTVLLGGRAFLSRGAPMVLEFCPYLIERAGSLQALILCLANYRGFVDLRYPEQVRPIEELNDLLEEFREEHAFTDILVL